MRRFLAILPLFAFALTVLTGAAGQEPQSTWITGVTIISPESLNHISTGNVLIEGERITRVDRDAHAKTPAGATVVSGAGLFLIPGLIDSHVHLASIPGVSFDVDGSKSEMVQQYLRQLPRSYLYFGYTTLVDLAAIEPQVLQDFRNAPVHPDLYDCGESLPFANGYPMSYAPPAVRFKIFPNFIYDPAQAASIPAEYKPEEHSPAAAVTRVKNSGGACIKTYFERGFGRDRNLPVMGPDVLADIRKAATQNGLVLMIHANSFEAQKFAADGNVDVIAHGLWNWGALETETQLPAEIQRVLDDIVKKKIGYQPTIQVLEGLMVYFDADYLKSGAISKVVPRKMVEWFNTPEGKWFKTEVNNGEAPDAAVLAAFDQGPIRRVRQVVAYLAAKDAHFLFGTDTPSAPTYGNLPGLNGYLEMQQLHRAGLSLQQIFQAATISNAREFKVDGQVGTIQPGKLANLVLLRKSPLESADAYDSIVTVWLHGRAFPRAGLSADAQN